MLENSVGVVASVAFSPVALWISWIKDPTTAWGWLLRERGQIALKISKVCSLDQHRTLETIRNADYRASHQASNIRNLCFHLAFR